MTFKPALRGTALVFLVGLAGCEHSGPFRPEPPAPAPPFSALSPRRLTFNLGDDRTPAWLPDGSGIIYSTEREDRPDHDRCLAELPPEGGTIRSRVCRVDPIHADSTDLMEAPAVSPQGRIFYHQVISWIGQQKLGASALMLAPSADPLQSTRVIGLPYTAPNGRIHSSVRSPQWIGSDTVVFLAEQLFYEGSTFFPDTFYTGLDVAVLDLSSGTSELQVIPGTDYASSVAVSEDAGALYYTLGGDSRILKRVLATGEVTTAYDFGSGVIARDVQVRGRYLVAVVGRSVLYRFEDAHGYVQRDEGGDLALVDLVGGNTALFSTDSVLFRHPVISPDGTRLVVEVQPFAPVHPDPDSEFNAPNHRADLWLFLLD